MERGDHGVGVGRYERLMTDVPAVPLEEGLPWPPSQPPGAEACDPCPEASRTLQLEGGDDTDAETIGLLPFMSPAGMRQKDRRVLMTALTSLAMLCLVGASSWASKGLRGVQDQGAEASEAGAISLAAASIERATIRHGLGAPRSDTEGSSFADHAALIERELREGSIQMVGQIRSSGGLCLQYSPGEGDSEALGARLEDCFAAKEHPWVYDAKTATLRSSYGNCLLAYGGSLVVAGCEDPEAKKWTHVDRTLAYGGTADGAGMCLTAVDPQKGGRVELKTCTQATNQTSQEWTVGVRVGQVKNRFGLCLKTHLGPAGGKASMWPCSDLGEGRELEWLYDWKTGHIEDSQGLCLDSGGSLHLWSCDRVNPAQAWAHNATTGHLLNRDKCLDTPAASKQGGMVHTWWCYDSLASQAWSVGVWTGRIQGHDDRCLVALGSRASDHGGVGLQECEQLPKGKGLWSYDGSSGQLQYYFDHAGKATACVEKSGDGGLRMANCTGDCGERLGGLPGGGQRWSYSRAAGRIQHEGGGCLAAPKAAPKASGHDASVGACDVYSVAQRWTWELPGHLAAPVTSGSLTGSLSDTKQLAEEEGPGAKFFSLIHTVTTTKGRELMLSTTEEACPACAAVARPRPEVVIWARAEEVCKVGYTLRSIALHDPQRLLGDIRLLWVSEEAPAEWKHRLDEASDAISDSHKVHFYDFSSKVKAQKLSGFQAQQVLKLKAASVVRSDYYVVLDAENTLVRDLRPDTFFSECNQAKIEGKHFLKELPEPQGAWFRRAAGALRAKLPEDVLYGSLSTPAVLHTRTVLDLLRLKVVDEDASIDGSLCGGSLCYLLHGDGSEQYPAELVLYYAYAYSRPNLECAHRVERSPTPWSATLRSSGATSSVDTLTGVAAGTAVPLTFVAQPGALDGLDESARGEAREQMAQVFEHAGLVKKGETSPKALAECLAGRAASQEQE